MNGSGTRATIKNFIMTAAYQVLAMAFGFIIPRMILETYGVQLHGLTSTITSIMAYVVLLNAGLSSASIQSLYRPLAKKDPQEINAVLNAIGQLYRQTGLIYAGVILLTATLLPFVIGNQISYTMVFALMLTMGMTNTLECFVYSKSMTLLQSDQKLFIITIGNIIALLIRGALQYVLLANHVSIVIVQAVTIGTVFVRMAFVARHIRRNYPYLDSRIAPNKKALSKRWSVFAHQISGLVLNNTDTVLLTVFGNLVLVSIYTVYQLVFMNLHNIIAMVFTQSSVASFGRLLLTENKKDAARIYGIYELLYYITVSVVYSVSAVMILPFVGLYTAGVAGIAYTDAKIAVFFVAAGLANSLRVPGGMLIEAAGHFRETRWRAILEAAINLAVSLVLVQFLGIAGVLLGTIASFAYRTTDMILYSNTVILKQPAGRTFLRAIGVLAVVAANAAAFNAIPLSSGTWAAWALSAALAGCGSFVTAVAAGFLFERNCMLDILKLIRSLLQWALGSTRGQLRESASDAK